MSYEAYGELPDSYCECCGNECSDCICPECPKCGEAGNPECYPAHGLEYTEEQIQSRIRNEPSDHDYDPAEWN